MDTGGERLALIERLDRDGHVLERAVVRRWPATVGRGWDNDLVLDDPHVAAGHLRVEPDPDDGRLRLQVSAEAHNGVQLASHTLAPGQRAELPRQPFEVGGIRLRVRWAGESLAAERPYRPLRDNKAAWPMVLLLWAAVAGETTLTLDPGAPMSAWLAPLLGVPLVLAIWAAMWGLLSKLFRHRFEYWPHVGIAARWSLAGTLLGWALPLLAFAFDAAWLVAPAALLGVAVVTGMLRAHALRVLPGRRKALTALLAAAALAFVGVQAVNQHQNTDRWIGPLYLSQLGPPWLRLAPAVPVETFVEEAAVLKEQLARRAEADLAEEKD